jgi:hypothetical protein
MEKGQSLSAGKRLRGFESDMASGYLPSVDLSHSRVKKHGDEANNSFALGLDA